MNLYFICLTCFLLLAVVSFSYWREWRQTQRKLADLKVLNDNLRQIKEALGDYNRFLASQKLGRHASDDEAIAHYISEGGARHFAKVRVRPIAPQTWPRLIVLGM